ncbi:thioesterase II family protein [Streptomyces lasalocidi]
MLRRRDRPLPARAGHPADGPLRALRAQHGRTRRVRTDALQLVDLGRPPVWLGLSARGTLRPDGEATHRHLLSDAELRRELAAMGGTPSTLLDDEELWDMFAPVIRADLRMSETWRTKPLTAPLPVPLSVFGGTRDQVAPPHRLDGWEAASEHFLGWHLFDGDHFYFRDRLQEVTGRIQDDVRRALLLAREPSPVTR